MDHGGPKHVEPPSVVDKVNHKTLYVWLVYIYIIYIYLPCISLIICYVLEVVTKLINMAGHTHRTCVLVYGGILFLYHGVRIICRCLNEGGWVWDRWSGSTEGLVICISL
jgi:hypothetical protein